MNCPLCDEKMEMNGQGHDGGVAELKEDSARNNVRGFWCEQCTIEILVICY